MNTVFTIGQYFDAVCTQEVFTEEIQILNGGSHMPGGHQAPAVNLVQNNASYHIKCVIRGGDEAEIDLFNSTYRMCA